LGTAWQALGLEFRFDHRQQAANAVRLMPPDDKVLALTFAITMPETRGTFSLAVPAAVSTALLRKMTADWAYRKPSGPAESKEQVKACVLHCPFPIDLTLLGVKVSAGELFHLQPGKLLSLDQSIEAPVTLVGGEHPLFEAFLMRHNRKRVARLSRPVQKSKSDGKGLS
jgi:flagellar motor switch protein FliM